MAWHWHSQLDSHKNLSVQTGREKGGLGRRIDDIEKGGKDGRVNQWDEGGETKKRGAEDESIRWRDERKVGGTEGEKEVLQHEGGGRWWRAVVGWSWDRRGGEHRKRVLAWRMNGWMACRENSMVGGATWSQSGGETHRSVTFLTLGVSVISWKNDTLQETEGSHYDALHDIRYWWYELSGRHCPYLIDHQVTVWSVDFSCSSNRPFNHIFSSHATG